MINATWNPSSAHPFVTRFPDAVMLANKVLESRDFATLMLAAKMRSTRGLSNREVLLRVVEDISVKLDVYYQAKTSAVAKHSNLVVYYNTARTPSRGRMASILIHETCHPKGFSHSFFWTPWRDSQVPNVAEKCAEIVLENWGIQV